jgi:hypothetical protein
MIRPLFLAFGANAPNYTFHTVIPWNFPSFWPETHLCGVQVPKDFHGNSMGILGLPSPSNLFHCTPGGTMWNLDIAGHWGDEFSASDQTSDFASSWA